MLRPKICPIRVDHPSEPSMTAVADFIEFLTRPRPRFVMHIPERTPYEDMVYRFEQGDPGMQQTMRLVTKHMNNHTEAEELALWKQRGEIERQELRPVVGVSHALNATPDASSLALLVQALNGASPALLDFYQRHDGGHFFADEADPECGILFFPIAQMADEPEYLRPWLDEDEAYWEETTEDGELALFGEPPWLKTAVIFGGIGVAAERFLMPTEGEHRGAVFEFSHDPLGFRRLAPTFDAFLELLMREPIKVATMVGLYSASEYRTGP
jgi:hypothetical protein